jgi:hypothetical protein
MRGARLAWAFAVLVAAWAPAVLAAGEADATAPAPAPSAVSSRSPALAERGVDPSKSGWGRAPIIRLPVTATPPKIDGDINEKCWQAAYHDEQFWDPSADRAPDQRTEIWLCVDADHLYFAAYMHDTSPGEIRAAESKRNGAVSSDDTITIAIDPTYRLGGLFTFTVNPLGTMMEDIPGGSDAKVEWHGDWVAGARRVSDGWTAEAAIPWAILRYPRSQREIALVAARGIPRTGKQFIWPDMGQGADSKEFAHIVGLRLPNLRKPVLIMPTVQTEWAGGSVSTHLGVDVSHTFPNGLTALATVTPDFSNIEEEVESIDFSYTERYYGDRRPFFTTGGGFMPESRLFYSRRIDALDFGVKVFGKTGDTDVGMLQTFSFGNRSDLAAHVRQQLNDEWSVDGQYVATRQDGAPHNQVWQATGNWSRTQGRGSTFASLSYSGTNTTGLPNGSWLDLDLNWYRGQGRWGLSGGYDAVDRWYVSLDGYVPETDLRGPHLGTSLNANPQRGWLKSYGASAYWDHYEHADGSLLHSDYSAGGWATRRHGDGMYLGANWGQHPPNKDHTTSVAYWWGDGQLHRGGSIGYTWGSLGSGAYKSYSARQSFVIRANCYADVSYEHRISDFQDPAVLDVDVARYTFRLNYDFSPERGLGLAVRTGDYGTNVFATYWQAARKGPDWFLILGDPNADRNVPRLGVMTKWVWK